MRVLAAYGWESAEIATLSGGLINQTYVVREGGVPIAVLQRLHPVFGANVNDDIAAVTARLSQQGMVTPHLIRTRDARAWVEIDGGVWRALTWVDGETVHAVPSPAWAEAGGILVGKFHRAVAGWDYQYAFARAGVHDTAAHFATLREQRGDEEAEALGADVLAAAVSLPELPATERRHCHGDLKISNLLFARDPVRGVALVDLDTCGYGTLAFELGDAMRSWCNPRGEDAGSVAFELPIFAAAMRAFADVAGDLVTRDERISIVVGLETVCLELAARFAVDVFRDSYFGWDAARFPSRRAHNLVRARGQLALGLAVRAARADALDAVLAGT